MEIEFSKISKVVSHALRHEPDLYGLILDDKGWVDIDHLLIALRNRKDFAIELNSEVLHQMIARSDKKRHEIVEGKIRAVYGHSIKKVGYKNIVPPEYLYHGTSHEFLAKILSEGLKPMGRKYVHLSETIHLALKVGGRKAKTPALLRVYSRMAHNAGIGFYVGKEGVFLSDEIETKYIEVFK